MHRPRRWTSLPPAIVIAISVAVLFAAESVDIAVPAGDTDATPAWMQTIAACVALALG